MSAHALSHKVFRGKIALEAQIGESRVTDSRNKAVPTINLVGATAIDINDIRHTAGYNWENDSIRLQVSPRELCDVLACLLGYLDNVEFTHHGSNRDKSYSIANLEKNKATLTMKGGGQKTYSFGLNADDRFELSTLCFRVLQRKHGGINADVLLSMLKDTYRST